MKKFARWLNGLKLNTKFTGLVIVVVVIPIAILAGVIYYNLEEGTISENVTYMGYTMERNRSTVENGVDAIRMSTQFILSDAPMADVLKKATMGERPGTKEMIDFYETDVSMVERLVNNNPLIYAIRTYSVTDNIQEMMPVVYTRSRMEKLAWAEGEEDQYEGWHFNYYDTLFSELMTPQTTPLLSLVTPVQDYQRGVIGYIEVSADMGTMFPALYESVENEWSCFIGNDGVMYYGKEAPDGTEAFLDIILEEASHDQSTVEAITKYYELPKQKKYVASYMQLDQLGGTLVSIRDISDNIQVIYESRAHFITLAIFLLGLLSILVNYVVSRMLRQFYEILRGIREVQEGNLDTRIVECSGDEMGELSSQLNTMLERVQQLMQDNINRELLVKNSEIRALQNQINAHFIYNVLETIKMMAEIDEEYAISDAITALGKLLRYSMKWVSSNVLVRDELEYIKNYVALINLRFDYEIILSVNIPPELMLQQIPKMSLQPIVENAILHGIEEVAEDTTIYIKAYMQENDCMIEITDSGQGMTEEQVTALKMKIAGQIETSGGSGNGIGLKNVQDRITMAFGEGYGLDIVSQVDCFTKIIVHLPHEVSEDPLRAAQRREGK